MLNEQHSKMEISIKLVELQDDETLLLGRE
jgi:hypothetical protein